MHSNSLSAGQAFFYSVMVVIAFGLFPDIAMAGNTPSLDNSMASSWVEFAKDVWRWVSTIAVLGGMSVAIIAYLLGADAKWLKYAGVIVFFGAAGLAVSQFIFEVTGADSMLNEGTS